MTTIQTKDFGRLDDALAVMGRNIAAHFKTRSLSWFMAAMTFGVGIAMTVNPTMLRDSIGAPVYFAHMVSIAPQPVWRILFLVVGTSRLLALAINGSFPTIWWTPHVRAIMSSVSALLWSQVAISVLGGEVTIGTIVYPFIVLIEINNMVQAAREAKWGHYDDGEWD
jgi:hypothetical protein